MSASPSPFYPPRARGWGRLRRVSFALQRVFYASPVKFSDGFIKAVSGCIVPGYVFRMIGYPIVSRIAISAYATAAFLFLIALGFPLGNYAFAFMLTLHAVSALLAFRRFVPVEELRQRLITAAGILVILIIAYLGLQALFGKVITPLRYNGKVYVVNGLASANGIKQGERIAYHIASMDRQFHTADAHGAVIVEEGFGLGAVLAVAGDKIVFTKESCVVNGISFPHQQRMPESGELVVPENRWFIWPDFAIDMQGEAAEIQAGAMLMRMGMVSKEDFAGRIFRHWFWRKQL
ncbi:MAG: hypothetical protein JWM68_5345 [Verrucomicrobiales bacterium]|nr:hypothetical protein [Verrucomicrobiales bacterium]